jgi:exodeoxyribonuclease-5
MTIEAIHGMDSEKGYEVMRADLTDESGDEYFDVPMLTDYFGKDFKHEELERSVQAVPFDFGYCLTTHKSQGSEWDNVLGIDEALWKTDTNRWRYTMFTRAARTLTVVTR